MRAQAGIRLVASCTAFDAIPPALWDGFKRAVLSAAGEWGLTVRFGEDDPSMAEAQQRFWQMQRVHDDARIAAETKNE